MVYSINYNFPNVYKYIAKKEPSLREFWEIHVKQVRQVSFLEDFSEPLMCQCLVGLQKWASISCISQSSLAAF